MQDLSKEVALNPLALIGTRGTEEMLKRIEKYIGEWRMEENPNYIIEAKYSRFGTGEAKAMLTESVRGKDLFILVDVTNHSITKINKSLPLTDSWNMALPSPVPKRGHSTSTR